MSIEPQQIIDELLLIIKKTDDELLLLSKDLERDTVIKLTDVYLRVKIARKFLDLDAVRDLMKES